MVNATNVVYDLNNATTANDMYSYLVAVNSMTNNYFMTGVLLVWFVILFVAFKNFGTNDALLGAGFLTMITTVMFIILDFVTLSWGLLIIIPFAGYMAYRLIAG